MRLRTQIFALIVVAIAVLIAGCGGGDDTTSSVTKAQFIRQADKICNHADKRQEVLSKKFSIEAAGKNATKADQIRILRAVGLQPLKLEGEELGALEAPDGDEEQVEEMVSAFEDAFAEADAEPLSMLQEPNGPYAQAGKLAAAYGLKACADAA
ncbi:MAG TPA: hypothetical protein VHR38_07770 [Solirubrobacterales bacterium]|jgi:hypothetical protein|nr:hypothetical protein [Solirubrobacterales bacterium]